MLKDVPVLTYDETVERVKNALQGTGYSIQQWLDGCEDWTIRDWDLRDLWLMYGDILTPEYGHDKTQQ